MENIGGGDVVVTVLHHAKTEQSRCLLWQLTLVTVLNIIWIVSDIKLYELCVDNTVIFIRFILQYQYNFYDYLTCRNVLMLNTLIYKGQRAVAIVNFNMQCYKSAEDRQGSHIATVRKLTYILCFRMTC